MAPINQFGPLNLVVFSPTESGGSAPITIKNAGEFVRAAVFAILASGVTLTMTLEDAHGQQKGWTTVITDNRGNIIQDIPIDIASLKFDDNIGAEQFSAFTGADDIIALQRFFGIKQTAPNFGPLTQAAVTEYKKKNGLGEGHEIDKATYEALAADMIRYNMELGAESINNQVVAKAAFSYLFAKGLGMKVEGRYGAEIQNLLLTTVGEVSPEVLLKATIGYLTRGNKYTYSGIDAQLHHKINQFVAGFEATYRGLSNESFIKEVGAGVTFFAVDGVKEFKLGEMIEQGQDVGDQVGAVTGGVRTEGFIKTLLQIAPGLKLQLLGGYFQAIEKNPLDKTSQRVEGLLGSARLMYDINSTVTILGKSGGDTGGTFMVGGGLKLNLPAGILSGDYERITRPNVKGEDRVMLTFTLPLGEAGQPVKSPGIYKETGEYVAPKDIPKDISWEGVVKKASHPKAGLNFSDLMPVSRTDTADIVVGGKAVTVFRRHRFPDVPPVDPPKPKEYVDKPYMIGLPIVVSATPTSITVNPGAVSDEDGVGTVRGVRLFSKNKNKIGDMSGDSVTFTITPNNTYFLATIGHTVKVNTDGTTVLEEHIGELVEFKPPRPNNPHGYQTATLDPASRTPTSATITTGSLRDGDGLRNVEVEILGPDGTLQIINPGVVVQGGIHISTNQTLQLTGLTPNSTYQVMIRGEVLDPSVWPVGAWNQVEEIFVFTTPPQQP